MWILPPDYTLLLAIAGAVQILVAAAALLAGGGTITWGRVLLSAFLVAGLTLATLVAACILTGANPFFAAIMVAWIDLVFVVPAAGLAVLLGGRRRSAARGVRLFAVGALCTLPPAAWASLVEPFSVVLERPSLRLDAARAGDTPLRIGILADIQTARVGDHERSAVARLLAEEPDLILVPGDLFHGNDDHWEEGEEGLRELLSSLHAPGGVFVVRGNCDPLGKLRRLLGTTACVLLEDRSVTLSVHDREVAILGLSDRSYPSDLIARFRAEAARDPGTIHLVLAHRPDTVPRFESDSTVDLVIAGHTHGGQVRLPFIGPPITLSGLSRRIGSGGLHAVGGTHLYVSRGLGVERLWAPRVRFLCPPEITLLTLE